MVSQKRRRYVVYGLKNSNEICLLYKVVKAMKWISTDDNLPNKEDLFLIGKSNGDIELVRWDKKKQSFISSDENGYDYEVRNVDYWLSIPELPKQNLNDVGCAISKNCSLQGCYRYNCCTLPRKKIN